MSIVLKTEEGNLIWLDAVSSFSEDRSGSVTAHPVQSGGVVADHFIKSNVRLSLTAVVSNFDFNFDDSSNRTLYTAEYLEGSLLNDNPVAEPAKIAFDRPNPLLGLIPESIGAFIPSGATPTVSVTEEPRQDVKEQVRNELIRIFEEAAPVSLLHLEGGLLMGREGSNLIMTNLSFSESPDTGDAVEFNASFEKVRFVTMRKAAAPKVADEQVGRQLAENVGQGGNANSGAVNLVDNILGGLGVREDSTILRAGFDEGKLLIGDAIDASKGTIYRP